MNELDWLTSSDPLRMLSYIEGRSTQRKLRLFACAAVRRYWTHLRFTWAREAVEFAQTVALGEKNLNSLAERLQHTEGLLVNAPLFEQPAYIPAACLLQLSAQQAARGVCEALRQQAIRDSAYELIPTQDQQRSIAEAANSEALQLCELLREVFGNPFRRSQWNPDWLKVENGLVFSMAQQIISEQRYSELPYLADLLMDHGCTDTLLLRHLQRTDGHVLGCWAVDLLLGVN